MMRIKDNSSQIIPDSELHHLDDFKAIAKLNISNSIENDLLIFSNKKESLSNMSVFSMEEKTIRTSNIMGFVGRNDCQVTIQSRFASGNNDKDYFLHYMIQKVFSINLFDLQHNTSDEKVFDFLWYLFPFFLKKALTQGVYKEYICKQYNNANVRGTINVARHIRHNYPFTGKIAYNTREHSHDNAVTQLIRHVIEFMKTDSMACHVLTADNDTQNFINQIIQATPSYNHLDKIAVINNNCRRVVHPYFSEYTELQKICLQILRNDGLKYGQETNKIYGLLFDGAWLWEEYLNTLLKDCGFAHPRNDLSQDAIYQLKEPRKYRRYPDFWKDGFIIDAKYKRLDNQYINREDMNQIISYMYVKKAKIGGFMYPKKDDNTDIEQSIGTLDGYAGLIKTWGIPIPMDSKNFEDFCHTMQSLETEVKDIIKKT